MESRSTRMFELKKGKRIGQVLFIVEAPRVTSEEDLANDVREEGEEGQSAADVPSDKGAAEESSEEEKK